MNKAFSSLVTALVFLMSASCLRAATVGSFPYRGSRIQSGLIVKGMPDYQYEESELSYRANEPGFHRRTQIIFRDGYLFKGPNEKLNAKEWVWIMDKHHRFYASSDTSAQGEAIHHSFFRKTKEGFGKSVVCAGHISVHDGKIVRITNSSGHYVPSTDQFLLCMHQLSTKGVFAPKAIVTDVSTNRTCSLQDIASIRPEEILSRYKTKEQLDVETSGDEDFESGS